MPPAHRTHDWGSSRLATLSVVLYLIGGQSIRQLMGQTGPVGQSVSGSCRGSNLADKTCSLYACLFMAYGLASPSKSVSCLQKRMYILPCTCGRRHYNVILQDYSSSATSHVHPTPHMWVIALTLSGAQPRKPDHFLWFTRLERSPGEQ